MDSCSKYSKLTGQNPEEFLVIKGLASSITQSSDRKKAKMFEGGECESFGSFMKKTRTQNKAHCTTSCK